MSKEEMLKILAKEYGIKTEQELEEAIENGPKLDIGLFVSRREEVEDEEKGVA